MRIRSVISIAAIVTLCCGVVGFTACKPKKDDVQSEEHVHDLLYNPAQAADCLNGGNVEYWICKDCGKKYQDEEATVELQSVDTQSLGHDWGEWNMLNETSHKRSCLREGCNETEVDPHTLDEDNHCSVCGYTYSVTGTEGLAFTAILEEDETIGYSVSAGSATATEIVIPYYYKGKPVTTIAESGFSNANVVSVDIPDSVVSIQSKAFWCSKLKGELVFSDNVRFIGSNAFFNCTELTKVTIGNGLQIIQSTTFSGCSGLQTVVIGNGVTTIFASAFLNCSNLKTLVIGSGIKTKQSIANAAFDGCKSLSAVYYCGTEEEWGNVGAVSQSNNSKVYGAAKYFYSETEPSVSGNYWHYDENGSPVAW